MATPQVPPRPLRTKASPGPPAASPAVPPRPARRHDRSPSPARFAPSPLNELPRNSSAASNSRQPYGNSKFSASGSSIDLPARPPSVSLPSIGQEGNEYGDLEEHYLHDGAAAAPPPLAKTHSHDAARTSHVAGDLPLHAPRPALSKPNARAQVAAVTRTDSGQAAAAGIGLGDDADPQGRPLKSKTSASFARPASSLSTDRPGSASQPDARGIPHIGQHVPMLPNAGDVQAPSPGPTASQFAPGIGFHNDGSRPPPSAGSGSGRHHARTRSGRETFHAPPGSYGLHGHGVAAADRFEKDWYAKHPEALLKDEEAGHYSPALSGGRPEFALSSDDLNKIVQNTGVGPAGYGASTRIAAQPDEQIGYMASQEYANRIHSPKRPPSSNHHRRTGSQPHVESPLRESTFPTAAKQSLMRHAPSAVSDDDNDAEDVIHIEPPQQRFDEMAGGHIEHREERGPDEAAPILASDECRPGSEWKHPAVSPGFPPERRGSIPHEELAHLHRNLGGHGSSANSSRANSRPGSRPGSVHGMPALSKLASHDEFETLHTPLEDVEEYEPLFPDDDELRKKPASHADRLRHRPDVKRRFPSQDIWEDAPHSLRLEAEVTSPEPPEDAPTRPPEMHGSAFENPEQEAARKADLDAPAADPELDPSAQLAKARQRAHLAASEGERPGSSQRFPSQDIWEDSPDSAALTATVSAEPEDTDVPAEDAGPHVPARPAGRQPHVPQRPPKKEAPGSSMSSEKSAKAAPALPDRPKPKVPARPSKQGSRDSLGSAEDKPATKPKPAVPARPMGSKIAALQSGFMSDLNNRLKIGPLAPAPKAEEKEEAAEDKAPLSDARKGRARGPARRKPAVSPGKAAEEEKSEAKKAALGMAGAWTLWEREEGEEAVLGQREEEKEKGKEEIEEEKEEEEGGEREAEPAAEESKPEAKPDAPSEPPAAVERDEDAGAKDISKPDAKEEADDEDEEEEETAPVADKAAAAPEVEPAEPTTAIAGGEVAATGDEE